jgi:hypothetical protein
MRAKIILVGIGLAAGALLAAFALHVIKSNPSSSIHESPPDLQTQESQRKLTEAHYNLGCVLLLRGGKEPAFQGELFDGIQWEIRDSRDGGEE